MTVELDRFLYTHGVPPDDFKMMQERTQNGELCVVEFDDWKQFISTNEHGRRVHRLIELALRLCMNGIDFSVTFFKPEDSKVKQDGVDDSDFQDELKEMNRDALITVSFEDIDDQTVQTSFYSIDGMLLNPHTETQPSLFRYPT